MSLTLIVLWHFLVRAGFGLLFMASGISKLLHARSVRRTIERYALLPPMLVDLVARLLAPAELASGLLMLYSLWMPVHVIAWTAATVMLIFFTVAIGSALARGIVVPCGCGAILGDHLITPATIARNLLLIALLAIDAALP